MPKTPLRLLAGASKKVVLVLMLAILMAMHFSPSASGAPWEITPSSLTIHDSFEIKGVGAGGFADDFLVKVGGLTAYIESSTADSLKVGMPASDPGNQRIVLEPKNGVGSSTDVGSITVAKYVIPRLGSEISEGIIKLRLAEGIDPEQVAIGQDAFRTMVPEGPLAAAMLGWFVVDVPVGSEIARIRSYADLDEVEVAEYDRPLSPARAPNDRFYPDQENVRTARLTAAWEARTTGYPIAILDSGVWPNHEELSGLVTHDRDCMGLACVNADPSTISTDPRCESHGTAVASIAAARTNNQFPSSPGIAGGLWSSQIGSYRVLDGEPCGGTSSSTILGINKAIEDGFRIINMSFGGPEQLTSEQTAVTSAWSAGAFMVAAVDNADSDVREYPADYNYVFSVTSSTRDPVTGVETIAPNRQHGSWVDLAAPGENVHFAGKPNGMSSYYVGGGTSFAAPLVASVAAMIRQSGLSNAGIAPQLQNNADQVNWGAKTIGGGRLNAYRALSLRGCLRDIPTGTWVRFDDGRVFQTTSSNTGRHVPNPNVLDSWHVGNDIVDICGARASELQISASKWGFRPGSLIRDGAGRVYLITPDGPDRGLPEKRWIETATALQCFGWSWASVRDDVYGDLAAHPTGPPISTCTPAIRSFPNGSLLISGSGTVYMIDRGLRRHVLSPQVRDSWFSITELIPASDAELALVSMGPSWGFRQGRLIQPASQFPVYFVTDDMGLRAMGSRRHIVDPVTFFERGYSFSNVVANVAAEVVANHPDGMALLNANNMP